MTKFARFLVDFLNRSTMAHSDQTRERKRERKSHFSACSRTYNESLKLLDTDQAEAFRLNYIAAQEGMHDAVLAMGWFYLNGVGVMPDEQTAIHWYRKSARHGEPMAMYSRGEIAYLGGDYAEALVWFKRAAENGHQRSNLWMGKMYWRGHGVAQDQKSEKNYFARAAAGKIRETGRILRYIAFSSRERVKDATPPVESTVTPT
jgi:TPR repeat protein